MADALVPAKADGLPLPVIPKLKGESNFPQWEGAVTLTLENYDLERFIESSVPQPEGPVDSDVVKKWKK